MTSPIDRAYVEILPEFREMNKQLRKGVEDSLKGVQTQLQKVSTDTHKMVEQTSAGALTRIGTVATVAGNLATRGIFSLAQMGKSAITAGLQTAAGMEQAQIAFGTLLHSTKDAKTFLGQLSDFAAKTPFELPGLIDASRQLLGVGVKAKDVIPTLTAYGDAAGALGISQDGFNHIMLATSQAMSAGTLHAGDLLQMTEAGLPVWKLLSEALHKPVSTLKDMSEKGQLISKDVLPKLQKQMEKDYGGAMSKQSQTLTGLWSTLMDTFHQGMANALLPMEPMLRTLIPKAADVMGKALKTVGTGAGQFFGGLSGNVKRMSQSDRPKLELFGLGVRAMFKSFKDGDATSKGFVGVMERIGVGLRAVVGFVKQAVAIFMTFAKGALKGLRDAFTSIQPLLKEFGTFMMNTVLPAVKTLATALASGLGGALKGVGGFMKDHSVLIRALVVGLGTALALYKAWVTAIKIWQVVQKVAIAIQLAWDAAMDANPIGLVVLAIAALVAGLIYAYKHSKAFRDIVDAVGRALKNAAVTVGHFFAALWDGAVKVFNFLNDLPNKIIAFFAGVGTWLVKLGKDLLTGFLVGIVNKWREVSAWFHRMLTAIGDAIGNANAWMKTKAVEFVQNFLLGLKITWHIVSSWFNRFLATIGTAIGNANAWMKNKAVSFIETFLLGLRITWHIVTDWFHQMLTRIGSAIGNANAWMRNKAIDFIQNFATGLRITWHVVTDWVKGMLGRIGTAIGNIKNWASGVGSSIINGILSGLQGAWNTVVSWFGKIPGWIKSALGIKSPPAWAVDAGGWIMKGLVKGLIGGSFSLTQFLKHFTGLARARLASFFGGAHGSVGAGGLHQDILALLAAVRKAFGNVRLISGLRPGAHTLSGNLSRHAVGEAIDIPAVYSMTRWISQTFGSRLRELISPWNELNILRGRHHTYTGDVFAQHAGTGRFKGNAHTHVAYQSGSWNVPRTELAMVHRGEMITPTTQAEMLRRAMSAHASSGSESGEVNLSDETIEKMARVFARAIGAAGQLSLMRGRQYGVS